MPVEAYSVGDIGIAFTNTSMHVQFFKNDCILGLAIASRVVSSDFSFDGGLKLYINNSLIILSDNITLRLDPLHCFNALYEKLDSTDFFDIEILFSNKNSLTYQKNGAFFIVDGDHSDDYYFDLECTRRQQREKKK